MHWPHSAAGACGTPNQYQTPFYDGKEPDANGLPDAPLAAAANTFEVPIEICVVGVFCIDGIISLDPLNTFQKIGVQAQVFTIVNDEQYYYPDLIRGMIVDGEMGQDIAMYTGSTTGTSRSNKICSRYTPVTWQVRGIYVSLLSLVRLFYFP